MTPFWGAPAPESGPVGLLAGSGQLPLVFAQAVKSLGHPLVVIGLEGKTDARLRDFAVEAHYIQFGAVGRIPEILKASGVKRVAMAGAIPKKDIYDPSAKLDEAFHGITGGMRNKGDDHLLRAFEVFLKVRCGVSMLDPRVFLKELLAPKGALTRRSPDAAEALDLAFGREIAKGIGKMDIGQTVVVKQLSVLAVEALEGTDAAIRRGGMLARGGAVVVKTSKPNQDLRFDLPCVGEETLESMRASGCTVLGIEAGKTLILSKDKFIERADREGVSVVGL